MLCPLESNASIWKSMAGIEFADVVCEEEAKDLLKEIVDCLS